MEIDFNTLIESVYSTGSLLIVYVILFFIANFIYSKTAGYNVKEEIIEKDNAAAAIPLAGYLLAISIVFIGTSLGPTQGIWEDIILVGKYSLLGIVLLYVAHLINDKIILFKFKNTKEIVDDRNIGTGAIQAGSYIGSGLIIAGAIHGEGGGLHTAAAFFALGQVALIIFSVIYNLITPFNVHDEIEKDNYAAGIAFSGTLIALGIILSKAAGGNFISWQDNGIHFLTNAVIAFILLPIFRVAIDKLVISNRDLNKEIADDRNSGAGFLEFCSTIGFASILFFIL